MKNLVLLILFCYIFLTTNAQKELRVLVVDKETIEPIPFASFSYFYSDKCDGLYSDKQGLVIVNLPKNVDSIKISCLGYSPITVLSLIMGDTITLQREVYNIREVLIRPTNPHNYKKIGFANKAKNINITSSTGVECAVFISNEYGKEVKIKSLLYNMKIEKNFTSAFRIHLYSCDSLFFPGRELLNANEIVYLSKKDDGLIEFDISKYSIKMPNNGIFVGMEWIGTLDDITKKIMESNVEFGTFIKLTASMKQQLTYFRSVYRNKNWDNSLLLNLPHNENLSLNAAFGLKVQKN